METKKALNEECDGKCGSSSKADERTILRKQAYEEEERKRKARMSEIKHKIAVISGIVEYALESDVAKKMEKMRETLLSTLQHGSG